MKLTIHLLLTVALIQLTLIYKAKSSNIKKRATNLRISEQKCDQYNTETKKIITRSYAKSHNEYPYMGIVGYKKPDEPSKSWNFICGTALVSPKYSITVAHCTAVINAEQHTSIARFGNRNIKENVPRLDILVIMTITHPRYRPTKRDFDISIMELEADVYFSRSIQPLCLWPYKSLEGIRAGISPGWGAEKPDKKLHETIRETKVQILDWAKCERTVKKTNYSDLWYPPKEYLFCGDESSSYVHPCQGSSGNPLVVNVSLDGTNDNVMPYAVGLTSFGYQCGTIGVYTRISSFIDWIESIVWG